MAKGYSQTKPGYTDDNKIHTGERAAFGQNASFYYYWGKSYGLINQCLQTQVTDSTGSRDANGYGQCVVYEGTHDGGNGQSSLTDSTASFPAPDGLAGYWVRNINNGTGGTCSVNTATNVTAPNHTWDDGDIYQICTGAFNMVTHAASSPPDSLESWIKTGDFVLRWIGTAPVVWSGGTLGTQTARVVDAQTHSDYDGASTLRGTFNGGTGHSVSDVITVTDGTTATVDAVSGGVVTQFTIDSSGDTGTHSHTDTLSQTATTGGGSGFSIWLGDNNILFRNIYTNSSDTPSVNYQVSISAGSCTKVELITPGEEARYDAGNICTSTFISDMAGVGVIRFMDWMETNSSPISTASELKAYDYATWYQYQNETNVWSDVPIKAICQVCNEVGCDLWICIPHQMDSAGTTNIAQTINAEYTVSGGKVYVERTNEPWNPASGFGDQHYWYYYGGNQSSTYNATFVNTTATATETSHGRTDADEIALYRQIGQTAWPYADGFLHYVIVDTVNTFRIAAARRDITAATQANPCVVTAAGHDYDNGDTVRITGVAGMTELNGNDYTVANVTTDTFELSGTNSTGYGAYTSGGYALVDEVDQPLFGTPIPATIDKIRYKVTADTVENRWVNYGLDCVDTWDIFETELGLDNIYRVGSGQAGSSGYALNVYLASGFREKIDYFAIAPYLYFLPEFNIQSATKANPCELTCTVAHGLSSGTRVDIQGASGMTEINGTDITITVTGSTTFTIPVDTSSASDYGGFSAYCHAYTYMTTAQIETWAKASAISFLTWIDDHYTVTETDNLIAYECGDHQGASGGARTKTAAQETATLNFLNSPNMTSLYSWYFQQLSNKGMKTIVCYNSHSFHAGAGSWGSMEFPGDTTNPKYLGHADFQTDGGVPKP